MKSYRNCWIWFLLLFPVPGYGQDCNILSKANDINPDQLCSPVQVVTWEVTYVDVNDAGTLVEILFDWDNGETERIAATELNAATSEWGAIASYTYISEGDRCNYRPVASLVVNGEVCTSSSQEQIVTVWDNDNTNGGRVNAAPDVYPICVGNGATMHFDDETQFNCVPPQEEDVPNNRTRWIQWVYGTRITMSGAPVRVDGVVRTYPFEGPVIELPGPVTGSDAESLPITVADDKLVGQEFEVELRYWNYCNPYPTSPPVTDRSVIRIVDEPDATITPVDTLCEYEGNLFLTAATGGGTWSGDGIMNESTGEFSPAIAGNGVHLITYIVGAGNSCASSDTINIVIRPGPDATISPVDPFCIYDAPHELEAASAQGTWSGSGITDSNAGWFDPAMAGPGSHIVQFQSEPDVNGCVGIDTVVLVVMEPPFAEFLTQDAEWCQIPDNQTFAEVLVSGADDSSFDLVLELQGNRDTLFNLSSGTNTFTLYTEAGLNRYSLVKIIEHHGNTRCETDLSDTLNLEIHPLPVMELNARYDDLCSPVQVDFQAVEGYQRYTWDFGDGVTLITPTGHLSHLYYFDPADWIEAVDSSGTIYRGPGTNTLFHIRLATETSFGCSDTLNDSIRIYPDPEADFFVNPEIQDFPGSEINLLNLSSPGNWYYQWDFGDGTYSSLRDPELHTFESWGLFDVMLTTFSPFCRDSMIRTIQITPPEPVAQFQPGAEGCPPLDVTFSNQSLYADTYLWDFDDGTYSTKASPTHRFWESKEHHVKLIAYGFSGTDTSVQNILVYPVPRALFEAYPPEVRNLTQLIKFLNNSINATDYLWDFGDGETSQELNPSHTYSEPGTYTVTLYAWSEQQCADTLVREKLVSVLEGEGNTLFPNAFFWNGSGPTGGNWSPNVIDNTVFHPYMENAVALHMIIYTRWGEMIWETYEMGRGWDGYLKSGELAQQGVYVYKAWVIYSDGYQEILAGDVTFLH